MTLLSRAWLVVVSVSFVACAQEPSLELMIDTGAPVPDVVDTLLVTLSASSPEGRVCQERTGVFHVGAAEELPLFVRVERGAVYTQGVAYRVVGYLGDAPTTAPLEGWASWPSEGDQVVDVLLSGACLLELLDPPCLHDGEHCADGSCLASPWPEEFSDPASLDSVSCWRED